MRFEMNAGLKLWRAAPQQGVAIAGEHRVGHRVHREMGGDVLAELGRFSLSFALRIERSIDAEGEVDGIAGTPQPAAIGSKDLGNAADVGRQYGNTRRGGLQHNVGQRLLARRN